MKVKNVKLKIQPSAVCQLITTGIEFKTQHTPQLSFIKY